MTHSLSVAMWRYSIEPRTRKQIKGYGFLSFARKYKKQFLDTGVDSLKAASKKRDHKTGEFLRNKIADKVIMTIDDKIVKPFENQENVEQKIILTEKREEILNKLRQEL